MEWLSTMIDLIDLHLDVYGDSVLEKNRKGFPVATLETTSPSPEGNKYDDSQQGFGL